jgi:cytochrome oxidase Cu insertion factor (SCO1/SenC/PrrC family)
MIRAAALLAILVCLFVVPGKLAAADLEDLLWDLHIIPLDNQPAPDFTLVNLEGKKVSLSQFRGRPVLLYFWATW